jgi:serine/threonine protein kinase
MSEGRVINPNLLLARFESLLSRLEKAPKSLKKLRIDWSTGSLTKAPAALQEFLKSNGFFAANSSNLNTQGLTFVSKLVLDFDQFLNQTLGVRYLCCKELSTGSESVTFCGRHILLGNDVCLKILRPGKDVSAAKALARLGTIRDPGSLVLPIDVFPVVAKSANSDPVELLCIVYPLINLPTFGDFLASENVLSPYLILEFINCLASGLAQLEHLGLTHGDLHKRNILCGKRDDNTIEIRIIDVTGSPFESSGLLRVLNDFDVLRSIFIQFYECCHLPGFQCRNIWARPLMN